MALVPSVGCGGGASECDTCLREKCADLLVGCDGDCQCMVDCTGANGIPGIDACLATCGLTERPAAFLEIESCTAVACPDSEDECATPASWTPPESAISCQQTTLPAGGGALPDCAFDSSMSFDPDGAILQLESSDGSVCARIERRDDGPGALANTHWTVLEVRVGAVGMVDQVDGAADQCWYSSHHNFRDWVHAWTGSRRFDLVLKEDGHGGARVYELYMFENAPVDAAACEPTATDGACVSGPIELFGVTP